MAGERRRRVFDATKWPWWFVAGFLALMGAGLAFWRPWPLAAVLAVVMGGGAAYIWRRPEGVNQWTRRHARFDGACLGMFSFLAFLAYTHWSAWWCALAGIALAGLGAALGERRRRQLGEAGVA